MFSRARRVLERIAQDRRLNQALALYVGNPLAVLGYGDQLMSQLLRGWGNEGWAATGDFAIDCVRHAWTASQPILECGSGLTTILMGAVAKSTGNTVWALEHSEEWANRVRTYLAKYQLTSVNLLVRPIRSYGDYSWYDVSLAEMPTNFGLVVCDGPPSEIPGGRYGLSPVMRDRLKPHAVILLDDARRPQERAIAAQWLEELRGNLTMKGGKRRHAKIVLVDDQVRAVNRQCPHCHSFCEMQDRLSDCPECHGTGVSRVSI